MPSRSDRSTLRAAALAGAAAAALLLGACGSGVESATSSDISDERADAPVTDATPVAVLLTAAESSENQPTVETTMRLSLDGEVVGEVTGQGAADGSSARISAVLPLVGEVPVLVTPEATFVGVPDLPDGAEWLRISVDELGLADAIGADAIDPPDPQRAFDALRDATDEATEVGPETIDGIETTRYRFEADVGELLDDAISSGQLPSRAADALDGGAATTETDVWIDADGLVRRLRFELRSGEAPTDPATAPGRRCRVRLRRLRRARRRGRAGPGDGDRRVGDLALRRLIRPVGSSGRRARAPEAVPSPLRSDHATASGTDRNSTRDGRRGPGGARGGVRRRE